MRFWRLTYCLIEPVGSQDEDDFEFLSIESKLLYLSKRIMLANSIFSNIDRAKIVSDENVTDLNVSTEILQ